ncbi:MAG: M64 family metallopeptidase [Gemmatimonadota bacterium]
MTGRVLLAVVAFVLAGTGITLPERVSAQELPPNRVVPLQVTGPADERLNLLVFGDGYTAEEMPQFRADVDRLLNIQWSIEPFKSYRSYFNVYMIEVESPVSGISCDPDDGNVRRDTPLRLQYAGECPASENARGVTFGEGGRDMVNRLAEQIPGVVPDNRQTLTVGNTLTYGGIGGTDATTTGSAPQGPLVSVHELGHSLGGLQDEYPHAGRGNPGGEFTGDEPNSIHHTTYSEEEMLEGELKWWRWLGEQSHSGGVIGLYESGLSRTTGVWRPSEHSMMRWIGYYFDQPSHERMIQRISGRRGTAAMAVNARPEGEVGPNEVLWVETGHPSSHVLDVTWTVDGTEVPDSHNSRNLELAPLSLAAGAAVRATVVDQTEHVRDPEIRNGPTMTQTHEWTVGATPTPVTNVAAEFTSSTPTDRPVAADHVVYVQTTHPIDRIDPVTWRLDGTTVPNPGNSRFLELSEQTLGSGNPTLTATVGEETLTWLVDNTMPTAPVTLSEPLTVLPGATTHNVYFEGFDMLLEPQDDQSGFVVGEFRLNHSGWFNYHGWPDAPEGTPYQFTAAGTDIKALVYGNLGTGGVSKAPFEQEYPDFVPGYKTHTVEHRAIDAAGNIGPAEEFMATVLPGARPACTTTLTGSQADVTVTEGVTCLDGATVSGDVTVSSGASIVVDGGEISGGFEASGGRDVQVFGARILGETSVTNSTGTTALVNNELHGGVTLGGNAATSFGLALVANDISGGVTCTDGLVSDFGAPNAIDGPRACGSF